MASGIVPTNLLQSQTFNNRPTMPVTVSGVPPTRPSETMSLPNSVELYDVKAPMLAKPVRSFDDRLFRWDDIESRAVSAIVEEKFDGERLICCVLDGGVTYLSRNLKRTEFRGLVDLMPGFNNCVYDGERVYVEPSTREIVALTDVKRRSSYDEMYIIFDVQIINGVTVYDKTLLERKAILKSSVRENSYVRLAQYWSCESVEFMKERFYEVIRRKGEGLMFKFVNGVYESNCRSWLKVKRMHLVDECEEFDLYAVRAIKNKNGFYTVLECGYYESDDKFVRVCKVSSGITRAIRERLHVIADEESGNLNPHIIVTVKGDHVTAKNSLRHPTLLRVRDDLEKIVYKDITQQLNHYKR